MHRRVGIPITSKAVQTCPPLGGSYLKVIVGRECYQTKSWLTFLFSLKQLPTPSDLSTVTWRNDLCCWSAVKQQQLSLSLSLSAHHRPILHRCGTMHTCYKPADGRTPFSHLDSIGYLFRLPFLLSYMTLRCLYVRASNKTLLLIYIYYCRRKGRG